MAITYKGIKPKSRRASNRRGVRTYSETHIVETDDKLDGKDAQWQIGSVAGLPQIGQLRSAYFTGDVNVDPEAWCEGLSVAEPGGYAGWEITATWTTENANDPTDQTNPLDMPAQFDWSGEQFQRPAIYDRFGELVGNAAGDPYDPPEMIDDSRLMCRIEKNVATVPTWIVDYQDAVNIGTFTLNGLSVQPQQAKFQRLSISRPQVRNGYKFHVLTFEIHLRREGWKLKPLNQGFRDNTGVLITLPDGKEPTAPVPLKADGSGALDPPSITTANFTEHEVYEALDFNQLPIT